MAKTTSQIIEENKRKRAEEAAIEASRGAIHQKQMASVADKATARTQAVLQKALAGTTDASKKAHLNSAIRLVAEGLSKAKAPVKEVLPKTADGMQKRKEDQMEEKSTVDYAEIRKKNAEKALADYDRRMGFDDRTAEGFKKYDDQRNRLQMEANRENDKYVQLRDTADIEAMSEEERQALEQYAVNRVRDQNLPLEMQGMMPTARQEAAGLIGKYGTRADELAETFMRQDNAELAQQAEEAGRKFANEKPVLASAATIPVNLMAAITGTVGQLQGAARSTGRYSTLDSNETGTALDKFSGAVREQTAQNIEGEDPNLLRKGASWLYQGGMSFADSMARLLVSGGSSGISSAIAASGAFSQGLQKYSAMGASPDQAAKAATVSAGLEYITEKLPTDKVLKIFQKGGNQNAVKEVLKQAFFVEPTGEEVNLFAGMAAEALILGENSSKQQRIGDLIAGGMTKDEAEKQFWKETFQEAVNTYAVSAVAGGLGAGGAAYAGNQMQSRQDQQPTVAPVTPEANPAPSVAPPVETVQQEVKPEAAAPAPEAPSPAPAEQPDNPLNPPVEPEAQPIVAPDPDYYDEFEDFNAGGANREEFLGRDWDAVGKKNVKAYMYEHPEVKPFFQSEAQIMLMELADTTRGERYYNEDVHYESGGESGWGGVKRSTSDDIAYLLDTAGFSYDQIQKGLEAIVHDKGAENNATSKRIEFILHNRLMNGHNDFYSNERVPASDDYVNLINEKQITTYDTEPVAPASNVQASASKTEATTGSPPTADNKTMPAEGGQSQIKGTGAAEGNFSGKPAYNATLSEDNAQADRRNDFRPMELPARDINGNNISAVTGNVYGAGVTPDEFASLMEEPTARGDFSYVPISNNQATQQAMDNITRLGWQDAYAQWSQAVRQGRAGAEMSARGALFLNHAAQAGDRQQWLNILSDFQRLGTNTAQGLQAFRILRNLAPSDRLYLMRRSVAQMVDDMHLNVPIQIDQQLADQYQNAQTNEEADAILDQIITDVAGQIPSTVGDRWTALRYVNMLGNMRTQARNISGNIGARATYMAKDQIGAFLEKIVHRFNPSIQRTKSAWVSRELKALGRADFDDVRDIVLENGRFDDARRFDSTRFAREVNERRQIFRSRFMESYRRLTNWAMNNDHFGDAGFARAAYARAFGGYLKANGFTGNTLDGIDQNLLDNARLYAIQQAQESTFRDHNAVSDWVGRIGRRPDTPRAVRALSEGVMPFRSTPANVLVRAEEFSPLGIINTAVTAAQAANPNSDVTGTDVIESMAKTLTGTGLLIVGAYLSKMGMLSGGPDPDDEQEAFDKMNGQQNYALQLPGGKSITIDFLSPMAVPMFLGAELEKIISDGGYDLADFEKVFTSLADPLIQMSMLQGINDTLDDIKYSENNLGQFFLNAAMSYLTQGLTNTLLGQLERSSEENRMTTYVDKDSAVPQWIQKQAGKMSQKIPGLDYHQTEYLDAWGQPQKNEGGLVYNLLSPGYISTERSDNVTKELNRLKAAGVEENVFPDMASATVTWTDNKGTVHENYNLTAEQHQTLAKTQGQTSRELLEDMFASKDYAALTDAQKAKAINSAYLYARKTGEIAAIDGHTGYDQTWMMDVKKKGASEILRQAFNSDLNGSMSALDSAWDNGYNEETFNRELQAAYDSYSKATPEMKKQVYEEAEGTTKRYLEARSKGISHSDFVAVAKSIATVKGTGSVNKDTGKATVRDIDKRKAIANTKGMTSSEIDILMKAYMPDYDPKAASPEMTELKYQYIREEMGLSPKEYATTYQAYLDADKRNKIAAIRALGYDYSTANALYKLYNGSMKKELLKLYG